MIVCADDYGLSDDIDAAILELAASRRLSAVSCMVILERCSTTAFRPLLDLGDTVDIGLHLCLTNEALPLSSSPANPLPSFGVLLRRALGRRLDRIELQRTIGEQYGLFVTKTGRRPNFIDGHLHVHQLPGIRDALVKFLLDLSPESRPYVRNTCLALGELRKRQLPLTKAAFIGGFGAKIRKLLRKTGISTNQGFAGIYDFHNCDRYREYLPRFVDCLPHANGMLVVHPGTAEEWRQQEAQALKNFQFPSGCPNRFDHRVAATSAIPCPE